MSKSKILFHENDSDSEPDFQITTNKEYAKSFNQLRQKEMLQKFKDKRLSDLDSDDLSSSSSEDDDEPINPEFSKTFFETLASLKSKDPKIYDKNVKFFETPVGEKKEDNAGAGKKSKKKGVTLESYERNLLLETNGKIVDSDEEDEDDEGWKNNRSSSPTIVEEERRIRDEFKKVLNDNDSDSDGENWGKIFKKKEKSMVELEKEEEQFTKWLAGKETEINEDQAKALNPLKQFWSNPKLSTDDKFLRDYILNNGYVEDDDTELNKIETVENVKLSDDEKEVEQMEEFEHKYNFRYEEPDQEFIKRYPRTIEHSVRKTDDKRKEKRHELKERKDKEKQMKMQELNQIKEIKRKEIEDKIRKLKEVTGNDALPFEDVDFEDDFDPAEHDKKMQKLFDDEYYQVDEGEQKPECPDIDELKTEDWDNYDPKANGSGDVDDYYEPNCEDDEFNMDADYDPEQGKKALQNELIENSRKRRRKRKSKFIEVLSKDKPVFDPEDEKNFGEYIDEYYKLDYEDIIGDTPCRFKYVETVPNDFGLSVEEILMAKNSELNRWASLKKAVQIRSDHVEKNEVNIYKKRAQNHELKKKIFQSIYGDPDEEDEEEKKDEKNEVAVINKKKNKNKKRKISETITAEPKKETPTTSKKLQREDKPVEEKEILSVVKGKDSKEKLVISDKSVIKNLFISSKTKNNQKKNGKRQNSKPKPKDDISDNRLRAFGLNPSKFRYKQKMIQREQKSEKTDEKKKSKKFSKKSSKGKNK